MPNSVAVLPFDNLSPDPDNAYFAAGIHEEILNQLAKLSELTVIARTSVLRYTDERPPIPEIAAALNVRTVMEGSVRYAGNRIRVTTQLIEAETGIHLWSETFDREFGDIFAVESDIAMNVANALEAEFSLAEQEAIERPPTNSPAAYALYLRAITTDRGTRLFSADWDRAIELDPEFALAYAGKAWDYSVALNFSADVINPVEIERVARESAQRALELDSAMGLAHSALAGLAEANWQWVEARERAERAYQLMPNDIRVIGQLGRIQRNARQYARAIQVLERGTTLDPNNPFSFQQLGITYRSAGDFDSSAAALEQAIMLNPSGAGNIANLGITEVRRGNFDEGVDLLGVAEQLMEDEPRALFRYGQMAIAYAQAGRRSDAVRLFEALEDRAAQGEVGDANWALAHIALGEYDRALELLEAAMATPSASNYTALLIIKESDDPELAGPRFQKVLSELWSE